MKETILLKIALICSLIGLIVLYFISAKVEVKDYMPAELSKNVGDNVKLKGAISKINDKGDVVFIEMDYQYPVNIVVFSKDPNLNLKNGDEIEVIGKVREYKGKNEIIAEKVRVIK